MVDRVKTIEYTEANVKHIVCPNCNGSGAILCIDLSTVPVPGRDLINGHYAEVCGTCRGHGWIHRQLFSGEEVSDDPRRDPETVE